MIVFVISALCLFVPVIAIGGYYYVEYGYTTKDFFEKNRKSKILALTIFILYTGYILFSGYLEEYVFDLDFYFVLPSVALGFILFARNKKSGLDDDVYMMAWVAFIVVMLLSLFEELTYFLQ